MESVYIVYYAMGSYDDYSETNYKVCFNKELAEKLANIMNSAAKEYGLHDRVESLRDDTIYSAYEAKCKEFESKFKVGYIDPLTGINFLVQEVEVYRE